MHEDRKFFGISSRIRQARISPVIYQLSPSYQKQQNPDSVKIDSYKQKEEDCGFTHPPLYYKIERPGLFLQSQTEC